MKKILGFIALIMLVPMVAFSMDTISDAEMEAVSGAGVSINFTTGATAINTDINNITYSDAAGSVNLTGYLADGTTEDPIEVDITIAAGATQNLTIAATAAGVVIGLPTMGVVTSMPANLNVKINNATIGSVGMGTFSVGITPPTQLTISAL